MATAEQRQYLIAGMVWSLWANFWTSQGDLIPPLHYLRMGGGEDFIFVSGVSEKQLDGFLLAVKSVPELEFKKQGGWWLHSSHWFGHWTNFSATIRPALDGVQRWRNFGGFHPENFVDGASSQDPTPDVQVGKLPTLRGALEPGKRGWGRGWRRNEGKP